MSTRQQTILCWFLCRDSQAEKLHVHYALRRFCDRRYGGKKPKYIVLNNAALIGKQAETGGGGSDHISRTIVRVNGLGLLMSINVCSVELSKGLRKISQKVPSSRAIFLLKVSTSALYYDTMQNGNLNKVNSHKIGTQRSLLRGGFKDLCKPSRSIVDSSIVE